MNFSKLLLSVLFFSFCGSFSVAHAENTCVSSMVSCPAATALSFDSTLKSREALTNAASCFSAIENLRNSCAYSLPDVAFYTVNGKVEGVHVFDRGLIEAATSCTSGTFLCGNGSVTRTRSQCGYSGIDAICVGGRWVGY